VKTRTQALIAFSAAMTVTLVAVCMKRSSPGELSAVHGHLSGRLDCSQCHGGIFGNMREACLECHATIEAQLTAKSGLHGTLGARAEQCGQCHAEHGGATAPLVHDQSFALAGAPSERGFDHRLIGLVLDGAHASLECSKCHANAAKPALSKGETRFLGLHGDCTSCHKDPHEGRFAVACVDCHGQSKWDGFASVGHARVLPLVGAHAQFECIDCHTQGGEHALELVGAKSGKPEPRDCTGCHESPHTPAFTKGAAERDGLTEGQGCVSCHASDHASFHEPALLEATRARHAATGFALDAPHDALECTTCHAEAGTPFAERFHGRAAQCSACHADPHAGQFAIGPFAGQDCNACHEPTRFEPHAFTPEKHALTGFELTGRHLELACEDCHAKTDADGSRLFRDTPSKCNACHADAHAGFFEPFLAGRIPPRHGECERCHDATKFAAAAAGFDHAAFTGFPLLGAHAEIACTTCHEPHDHPDDTGRAFGRVGDRFGSFVKFEDCATCHADVHGERFDSPALPASVEGHSGCARCHVESSFRTLRSDFDHGTWTGFPLAGAHARATCATCHAPIQGTSGEHRTTAEAFGTGCAACHEDPHAGQFEDQLGLTACERCHDDAGTNLLVFDHDQDSRFPLGDEHRGLDCSQCHAKAEQKGLVRYRPLGIRCVDCHKSGAPKK
jgi:hypothetical protein